MSIQQGHGLMLSRELLQKLKTVYTVKEIAAMTGYSSHTIKNYLYDKRIYEKNRPYVELTARNEEVKRLILEGNTFESVGLMFGLTRQRIDQIVARLGIIPPNVERRKKGAEERARRLKQMKQQKIDAKIARAKEYRHLIEVEGHSYNSVAYLKGLSLSCVLNFCKKYKIKSKHKSLNPAYR